jgi:WD40 repeat protein
MASASGYDAFISYSHRHDRVLGPRLQAGLQRLAKPWYRIRALRIFRDTTDLGASPALWESIEEALRDSRWFILLASPDAARSVWVNREVRWWLDHRSRDRLIIVGTGVGLAWDEHLGDWAAGAPVPPALRGTFISEPLWVDLSNNRTGQIPADLLAMVAAPIRSMTKDMLIGEHLRQRRRVVRLAGGTIAFLLALAAGLASVTVLAVHASQEADRQLGLADSRLLSIQSEALGDADPVLARQESLAAWRINPSVQAEYAMLNAATAPGGATFRTGGTVSALAFGSAGGTLASVSTNGTVQRWDLATGKQIGGSLRTGMSGFPGDDAFTRGAGILAGTSQGSTLRVWNLAGRHLIGRSPAVDANTEPVALSGDGTIAATGTYGGKAQVWNVATGQQIGSSLAVSGGVTAVALSPDGRILATVSNFGVTQLWDADSGQRMGSALDTTSATGTVAAFSPDGKILAVGTYSSILLFNVATRTLIGQPLTSGWVQSLAFSADGATLAAGCMDGTAMLWNVAIHQQIGGTLAGGNTSGPVYAVAFSPDGRTLATGSRDGTVRLWDVGLQLPVTVPLSITSGSTTVLSTDGKTWATQNGNGTIQLGDVASRRQIDTSFTPHNANTGNPALSLNSKYLAFESTSSDGGIQLWDIATGHTTGLPNPYAPTAMAISPNGKTLAVAYNGTGTIQLWDVATRRPIGSPFPASTGSIYAVAFSPDGNTVVTGSTDDTARLWDVATHRQIGNPFITSNWVTALAFSPDGATLATGSIDGTVRLWDLATDQQIGSTLDTGFGNVSALAFSADGKTLKTIASDNELSGTLQARTRRGIIYAIPTLQLWDVPYLVNTAQYLCALVDDQSMTRSEWVLNAPGVPYQSTCP